MDRRLRNRILLFLVLAAAAAYGLYRLSGRQPAAKIAAVMPQRENLVASISSNGKVEPIAPSVIRAELATFVAKVSAVEGHAVKKGQLLLELDVKDAVAQLAQARANRLRAEDDLRAARAGGRAGDAARVNGDPAKVGDLLAEMADLRKVRVRAFIDEPELGGLEPEQPVVITWDALPNRTWQGRTEVIPKQVVPRNSRSVGEVLCSVNNDKLELLPNINVNVRIIAKQRINVLAVPRGAVDVEGGRRYVYVVKDGPLGVGKKYLEKREIQVGVASATSYEVAGGLQEGEMVALPGDVDLKDGMAVRVVSTR